MDQNSEQPPTAAEAAEVHSEWPKTKQPLGKGYLPILNLLGSLVSPCISDKQEYRIRGLLIYMSIFNHFSFNFKSHFSVSLTRGLALKLIFSLVKTRFAGYKKVKLVKCPISRHILATNLKVHQNDDFLMFCH